MRHRNPIQFNDWDIRSFIVLVIAMQLSFIGLVMAEELGITIPLVTPLVTSAFISFIPGYTILRVLKIHERGNIISPLFAVGISLAIVMFTGLALNTLLPAFHYATPIDRIPISISLSLITMGLTFMAWVRDKDWVCNSYFETRDILRPGVLAPLLLPLLSVIGALVMNQYGLNYILLFVLFTVSAIAILVVFDKISSRNLPLVILSISVALLLHKSLISYYISGWDIQHEYWIATQVLSNSHWTTTLPFHTNSMLSITILAPTYSLVSGLSLVWVFKIIYPLIYSLMPLALFYLFRKQTGDKIAFLSVFFFMSFFFFYGEMLALARQQIAELFLALVLLLIVDSRSLDLRYYALFILFSVGLIVSHYGLTYLFILILTVGWLVLLIEDILIKRRNKFRFLQALLPWLQVQESQERNRYFITGAYLLFFISFTLFWSTTFSSSSVYIAIKDIADSIIGSLNDMFNPSSAQGLYYLVNSTSSMLSELLKWAQLIAIFLIIISIVHMIRKRERGWKEEFVALSLAAFAVCVMAIAFPYFASNLNSSRIYHMALIFLSPFCIAGALILAQHLSRMLKASRSTMVEQGMLRTMGFFLTLFLLLNAGVVHELTNDHPISSALDGSWDDTTYTNAEVTGGLWLDRHFGKNITAYVDHNRWPLLNGIGWWKYIELPGNIEMVKSPSLIFLGDYNVKSQTVLSGKIEGSVIVSGYIDLSPYLDRSTCLYTSGTTQVYLFM